MPNTDKLPKTGTNPELVKIEGQIGLYDWIRVMHESQIFCNQCDNHEYASGEHENGAKVFYKNGWRATKDNVYCPVCASKNNLS